MKPHTPSLTAALVLLGLSAWLWMPTRNSDEKLVASCSTAEGTVARLYRGEAGATVPFWYSVTVQRAYRLEKQVLYAYRTPPLERIECRGPDLWVQGQDFTEHLPAAKLEKLQSSPLTYWNGERREPLSRLSLAQYAGLALLMAALVLLVYSTQKRAISRLSVRNQKSE